MTTPLPLPSTQIARETSKHRMRFLYPLAAVCVAAVFLAPTSGVAQPNSTIKLRPDQQRAIELALQDVEPAMRAVARQQLAASVALMSEAQITMMISQIHANAAKTEAEPAPADDTPSVATAEDLAHNRAQFEPVIRKHHAVQKKFDDFDIQPARKYSNDNMTTYPEFDSSATITTAGGVQKGRGDKYTDFHGSEVAFWKDAEKIVAGAMQGGNPDVILESTPNGAQGYFYDRCIEAIHDEGVWKLHCYPWWWDDSYRIPLDEGEGFRPSDEEYSLVARVYSESGGLFSITPEQLKWRRNKMLELKEFFKQEYPEDPLTCFGGQRIDLTAKEFALLALLLRRQGEVLSRALIASQVWDMNFDSDTNVVDVAIKRLRAKVDEPFAERLIHTVRDMGYVLERR